jgi:hypothetical protein
MSEGLDPRGIDYWLAYWIAAFEHIASLDTTLCLVPHERLCEHGPAEVARLCAWIGVESGADLDAMATEFRAIPPRAGELAADQHLLDHAEAVHAELLDRSRAARHAMA